MGFPQRFMSGKNKEHRIAMWSGPRNISTAMMRAWENRPDTAVTDEPLYGYYLLRTGADHPGRDAVIGAQETDPSKIAKTLNGPIPDGKTIWYQKHMTHHLLPDMDRGWLAELCNCFLVRAPQEVLASYVRTRANPTIEDLGYVQQREIFELVRRENGVVPPVVDARDVLEDPREMLTLLCRALGVPFSERMLSWPAGRRDTDGVWARYWYHAVERSTGFMPYRGSDDGLPEDLEALACQCEAHYRVLYQHRLGR